MTVDEVYSLVGRENVELIDLYGEGMFAPGIAITLPGATASPALVAPIREWPCFGWSIQGIQVHDARLLTEEGVGVGSTLGDLRSVYEVRLSNEEGPHAWVESNRMNFGLEDSSRADGVRVHSIWLPGDPVEVQRTRCPDRGRIP